MLASLAIQGCWRWWRLCPADQKYTLQNSSGQNSSGSNAPGQNGSGKEAAADKDAGAGIDDAAEALLASQLDAMAVKLKPESSNQIYILKNMLNQPSFSQVTAGLRARYFNHKDHNLL